MLAHLDGKPIEINGFPQPIVTDVVVGQSRCKGFSSFEVSFEPTLSPMQEILAHYEEAL